MARACVHTQWLPFVVLEPPRPQLGESSERVVHIFLVGLKEGRGQGPRQAHGPVGLVRVARQVWEYPPYNSPE